MQVVKRFDYTGKIIPWTVPLGCYSIKMELWGASGSHLNVANGAGTVGFSGATGAYANINKPYTLGNVHHRLFTKSLVGYVTGTLNVASGDIYYVVVGGAGGISNGSPAAAKTTTNYGPGGWNGGGRGGYATPGNVAVGAGAIRGGGGGGGATDVRSNSTLVAARILVAGGGGGGGTASLARVDDVPAFTTAYAMPTTPTPPYFAGSANGGVGNDLRYYAPIGGPAYGGSGGNAIGGPGGQASDTSTPAAASSYGKGGTQGAGGAGGSGSSTRAAGAAGAVQVGGAGGDVSAALWSSSTQLAIYGGGGGGGGFYGGGGGSSGAAGTITGVGCGGGGGGGSNYVHTGFSARGSYNNAIPGGKELLVPAGNGVARFTYTQFPDAPTITFPDAGYIDSAPGHQAVVRWQFTSPAPDAVQAGFDIQYRQAGSPTWINTSRPSSTDEFFAFPANLFGNNSVEIQVRTYDQSRDVSGWSYIALIGTPFANPPVITAPTSTVSIPTPQTVTWTVDSGVSETLYQVQEVDASGAPVVDSGMLSSSRENLILDPGWENTGDDTATGSGPWQYPTANAAYSTVRKMFGTKSIKLTWVTAAAGAIGATIGVGSIVPGMTYTVSIYATVDNLAHPTVALQVIDGITTVATSSATVWTVVGTFVRISTTFIAQSPSVQVNVYSPNATTSAQVVYLDGALLELGDQLNPWFSGADANGQTGTASWPDITPGYSRSRLIRSNILSYVATWPRNTEPITLRVRYAIIDSPYWSDWTNLSTYVNVLPPGIPAVVLTTDDDAGSVTLAITANNTPNPTVSNDIYRTNTTLGEPEKRIATGLAPTVTYVDRTPVNLATYTYRVRSLSATAGFADAT